MKGSAVRIRASALLRVRGPSRGCAHFPLRTRRRRVPRVRFRVLSLPALALAAGAAFVGSASPATQIVGGSSISIQASPSTVYVQYQDAPDDYERCTGSLIDASHVLTA